MKIISGNSNLELAQEIAIHKKFFSRNNNDQIL